jgi:hypothetical protein
MNPFLMLAFQAVTTSNATGDLAWARPARERVPEIESILFEVRYTAPTRD